MIVQGATSQEPRRIPVYYQFFEGKKDIILFAIDCSESMQSLYDDPQNEGKKTSHLFRALEAVMQIQKRKVIVGPNDAVGIMFFNTVRGTAQYKCMKHHHLIIMTPDSEKRK